MKVCGQDGDASPEPAAHGNPATAGTMSSHPVLSDHLCDLAERIGGRVARYKNTRREAVEAALEAGRLLLEARRECRHGQWIPFLARAALAEHTAREWMILARAVDEGRLEATHVADVGIQAGLDSLDLPGSAPGGISPEPWCAQSGFVLRDALRVLSLVRALHEAGYQRVRVSTGLSPSGLYWRCLITSADNVQENGWAVTDPASNVVHYSTADGAAPFGWNDAGDEPARELARRFVERFPETAARGAGSDPAYADWFAVMMAIAETGQLPIFFADFELDLSGVSVPPPGEIRRTGGTNASGDRD